MDKYSKEILELVPPGFDLENYTESKTCNVDFWESNLHERLLIHTLLPTLEERRDISYEDNKSEAARDLIDKLFIEEKRSLLEKINRNIQNGFLNRKRQFHNDSLNEGIHSSSIIQQANINHLLLLISDYENYKHKNTTIDPETPLDEFAFFSRNDGALSIAAINIKEPDNILIKEFKVWLKEVRRSRGIDEKKSTISSSVLREWHNSKVLPYIDLVQWHMFNNTGITQGQIGQIIRPEDNSGNVESKTRITTAKNAKQALDYVKRNSLSYSLGIKK